MGNYDKCKKKLRFFKSNKHPELGKKYLTPLNCFDVIDTIKIL
jgi:hypothetical protein